MGIVYRARDLRLERVVAITLLPRERARTPAARDRFLREARTAARLSHPHIIPIHAVEEAGEFGFFVMGYVDGETLGARVRREQRRLKFWKGFMGRWLFKLAGIGLKRGAPGAGALAPGDRPTEAALGLAALELFEALPADTRRVLGDLPA